MKPFFLKDPRARFAAAMLAVFLAWGFFSLPHLIPMSQSGSFPETDTYPLSGESILHGFSETPPIAAVSQHLPLSNVLGALSRTHWGRGVSSRCLWALALFWIAAMFCAGLILGGWSMAFAASALWIASLGQNSLLFNLESQSLFAPVVFLTAFFLVWEYRAPSWSRRVLLGLSLGVCIFYRSPLAFFPPLWIAFRWFLDRKNSTAPPCYSLLAVLILPYLFLIPWIKANWILLGGFVPLEYRQTHMNIVTGALGLTNTMEGNWRDLLGASAPGDEFSSFVPWVLREVFSHPLRYALAYLTRIAFVFWMQPIFAGGTLLALILFWKERKDLRPLGMLAAYFTLIHCFMSVEEDYFRPLLPLLILLTASLASRGKSRVKEKIPAVFFHAALGVFLILAFWTGALIHAYPAVSKARPWAASIDREAASHPHEAWMQAEAGRNRLKKGEFQAASAALAKAVSAWPGYPDYELDYWAALAFQRKTRPLLKEGNAWIDAPLPVEVRRRVLRAAVFLKEENISRAREELKEAVSAWKLFGCMIRARGTPFESARDRAAYEKLSCAEGGGFARDLMLRYMVHYRESETIPVLKTLLDSQSSLDPSWPGLAHDLASQGALEPARLILSQLFARGETPHALSALKKFPASRRISILENAAKTNPGQALLWSELAMEAHEQNRLETARAALRRLVLLHAPPEPWMRTGNALSAFPFSERARILKELARAQESPPQFRHWIALRMQEAGEYSASLEMLRKLVKEDPGSAVYHSDKGVCSYLAGLKEDAVSDLKRAIELDPALLSAYVSLGAIYSERALFKDAAGLYERALRVPRSADNADILNILENSRRELLPRLSK